jgi:hypothetical protein
VEARFGAKLENRGISVKGLEVKYDFNGDQGDIDVLKTENGDLLVDTKAGAPSGYASIKDQLRKYQELRNKNARLSNGVTVSSDAEIRFVVRDVDEFVDNYPDFRPDSKDVEGFPEEVNSADNGVKFISIDEFVVRGD